jgi:phage terminase large subunit
VDSNVTTEIIKPNAGPQTFVLQLPYTIREILYGGSRGGGKTFAGQMWLTEYFDNPSFSGLVVRLNALDLADWIQRAKRMYRGLGVTFVANPMVIRLPAGGIVQLGHLGDDNAYEKYQGQEFQKILIEELTQIPNEERYLKLISSCRSTHKDMPAQVFATTNPGGQGHSWVKARFVEPVPPNQVQTVKTSTGSIKRIFVPSSIDDTPQLQNDKDYVAFLDDLKNSNEMLYRAWRLGDWDVFSGQVFSEFKQWNGDKPWHVIPKLPFNIMAKGVRRYIGMDWGFGHDPAALEWIAVTPPNYYGVRHYYVYREMSDLRVEAEEWIRRVADVASTEPIDGFILPADTYFHKEQSNTIADRMDFELRRIKQFNPNIKIPIIKGVGLTHSQRINRQAQLHSLLATQMDGEPGIMILDTCRKLIETIPSLPFSQTDPETVETKRGVQDHWYDALTYGLYYIADQPAPKELRMSEGDILSESYGDYARADFRPAFDDDSEEWRQR